MIFRSVLITCFDPLDGSSNIDINLHWLDFRNSSYVIIKRTPEVTDFLQPGTALFFAGAAIARSAGDPRPHHRTRRRDVTLDDETFRQTATTEYVTVLAAARIAINMSNQRFWEKPVQRYISELLAGGTAPQQNFNVCVGCDGG